MAGLGFQKTSVSRWDVVLTAQLTAHASVSIKPVRFCFLRSLACVYCRKSEQRLPWGQVKVAIVAIVGRQGCDITPVFFLGGGGATFLLY